MTFELWYLVFVPLAAVIESILHEASHAVVARTLGYKNVKIYPCRLRVAGHWAFGGFSYQYDKPHPDERGMWIAPVATANVVLFVSVCIAAVLQNTIPLAFTLCALVDLIVWLKGYAKGSPDHDGQKYRNFKQKG